MRNEAGLVGRECEVRAIREDSFEEKTSKRGEKTGPTTLSQERAWSISGAVRLLGGGGRRGGGDQGVLLLKSCEPT